jgi:lipoate-protein ligase A
MCDAKVQNNQVLTSALQTRGLTAIPSGRNDLHLDGKKISGSAFQRDMGRNLLLHHGTMLLDVDPDGMERYLNPDKAKLAGKGISSVKARVTMLSNHLEGYQHEDWCKDMEDAFRAVHASDNPNIAVTHMQMETVLATIPEVAVQYEELKDWAWRLGKNPQFTHETEKRFSWGNLQVHFDVKNGTIASCELFSDSLHPTFIEALQQEWVGVRYNVADINGAISTVADAFTETQPVIGEYCTELQAWMTAELK